MGAATGGQRSGARADGARSAMKKKRSTCRASEDGMCERGDDECTYRHGRGLGRGRKNAGAARDNYRGGRGPGASTYASNLHRRRCEEHGGTRFGEGSGQSPALVVRGGNNRGHLVDGQEMQRAVVEMAVTNRGAASPLSSEADGGIKSRAGQGSCRNERTGARCDGLERWQGL